MVISKKTKQINLKMHVDSLKETPQNIKKINNRVIQGIKKKCKRNRIKILIS